MRSREQVASLPFWMLCMGAVTSVGSAILAVRLIWEQTALSWRYGPQMVGFSLAHGRGIILLCFPIGLVAWLLLIAAMTAISVARKQPVSPWRGASGVAGLALLGLLSVPYGTWQRVFADRIARGPHAADFLSIDAATGDLRAVKPLLSRGVPVNARTRTSWQTALHAAAVGGQTKVIEYLISRGADVNALDRYGDSPLEAAAEQKHDEAARLLVGHGARRVRGDEAHRREATRAIVEEEMDRSAPLR